MYAIFVTVAAFLIFVGPSCTTQDNFALLLDTLKPVQQAVCDDEMVSLACPRGTMISVLEAKYGNAAPPTLGCVADTSPGGGDGEKCKRPNALQYSLLQTVVEACQKKPQCTFSTQLKPGLVDPCPLPRKYVEVSYKCRPAEFRSQTVCKDKFIKLSCNPHSRIAIYDARFSTKLATNETTVCLHTPEVSNQSCVVPNMVDKVMRICLGKRRCQILANITAFGPQCQTHSNMYLKVVYACVPKGVIKERHESAVEKDEMDVSGIIDNDNLFDETEESGEKWRETSVSVANPAWQNPVDITVPNKIEETTITTSKPGFENTKEISSTNKLFIYVGGGIIIFACLVIILIGVRCCHDHRVKKNSKNGDMFTTEAPNVFNDAVSDVDNDMDVSHISGTFYDPLHPDMILYRDGPGTSAIRAMRPLATVYPCSGANMYGNIDCVPPLSRETNRFIRSRSKEERIDPDLMTSPKSLSAFSNQQFYYG